MFAAFVVSSEGALKDVPIRAKHHRVQTGCFECRKRKRKCDERLPVCGGCRRFSKSLQPICTRPQIPVPVAIQPIIVGPPRRLQSPSVLTALLPSTVSQTFSTPEEGTALQALDAYFRTLVTPFDLKLSIFDQLVPVACESSSVKNALVACGYVILTNKAPTPPDDLMTLFYGKTVSSLRREMKSQEDAIIGAALLLHIFEHMQQTTVQPNLTHLRGALAMEHNALLVRSPTNDRGLILLESCIYQVVVSTTFGNGVTQVLCFLPDDYVSVLLKRLKQASEKLWPGPLWRKSAFLGVSHDLFDIAFRLSHLRRRTPLNEVDKLELAKLDLRVKSWHLPTFHNDERTAGNVIPPLGLVRTANLYFLACSLFLQKLIQPTLQASDEWVRGLLKQALDIMDKIPLSELATPIFSWPLTILSCGAWTEVEKGILRKPLAYFWMTHKLGHTLRILKLIGYVWMRNEETGQGPVGLNIFLSPVP